MKTGGGTTQTSLSGKKRRQNKKTKLKLRRGRSRKRSMNVCRRLSARTTENQKGDLQRKEGGSANKTDWRKKKNGTPKEKKNV